MKNHRHIGTDEQIEEHSLPGINMAGKKAGVKDCERSDEDDASERKTGEPSDQQTSKPKPSRE